MSSNQSPPNAGYPSQPGPGFVVPPGAGYYSGQNPPPLPLTLGMYSTSYPEDPTRNQANDNEEKLRLGFIRKVNSLLMSQLLFTFGFVALLIFFHDAVSLYIQIIFVGAASVLIGVTSRRFQKHELLLALVITIGLCFSLTLFAFLIKFALILGQLWNFVSFSLIGFLIFGIITKFFLSYIYFIYIYGTVGAIIFSYYFYIYIQWIINAENYYPISPLVYVFPTSYLINIFGYILMIIGGVNHKIS